MRLRQIILTLLFMTAAISAAFADFPVRQASYQTLSPAVAYNSTDHQYLAVWTELTFNGTTYFPALMGQRLAEDGSLLGSAFQIFFIGSNPTVAYNSTANEYLVGFNPGSGYAGRRVSAAGNPIGDITGLMDGVSHGRLMYNAITNEYLFVGAILEDNAALGSGYKIINIKSRRIGADGQPLADPVVVESRPHGYQPPEPVFAAAFAPIQSSETPHGRYLVVIGRTVVLKMLDSDGAPMIMAHDPYNPGITDEHIPFTPGNAEGGQYGVDVAYGTSSSYSMTGPAFLVVWADNNNSFGGVGWVGIYGGFVDALKTNYLTTDIQDHSFPLSFEWDVHYEEPYAQTWRPKVDFNYSSQKFYVTWRLTPGTNSNNDTKVNHIRGADVFERIPSSTADNVIISATVSAADPQYPAVASSSTSEHALIVWQDYRDKGSSSANIYGSIQRVADPVPPPPPPPPITTWIVTNTNDAGTGSLRQAILLTNGRIGTDTIAFNIPGTGIHTIQPLGDLPAITDPVLIDGYTQPGSQKNTNGFSEGSNALLKIEIDGEKNPVAPWNPDPVGLRVNSHDCTLRGLIINRVQGAAIKAGPVGYNTIVGNFLGTDATGTIARPNTTGVDLQGSRNNQIGGTSPESRNVISGNRTQILIQSSGATDNVVQGNYIGTSATGATGLGEGVGILIQGSSANTIGGTASGGGNVIYGGGSVGPGYSTRGYCIALDGDGNLILGNLIGTNAAGNAGINNFQDGIAVIGNNNIIGGTTAGARNIISGNHNAGIYVGGKGNLVQGNFLGPDITGTKPIGNGVGIEINVGQDNIIGGRTPEVANVISSNVEAGIVLETGSFNRIEGNKIGTQVDGVSPLANSGTGISMSLSSANNTIGGVQEDAGNIISFNSSKGVLLATSCGSGNRISSNSFYSNGGIGIDFAGGIEDANGVTANDPGDADTGPNGLQNYPVLNSVEGGDHLSVEGKLNSTPNTTFRVEFFSTPTQETGGSRQGKTYLTSTDVVTDGGGNAGFSFTYGFPVGSGIAITATATDPNGNTSELSDPVLIQYTSTDLVVTSTNDDGPGSLRQAILAANALPGKNTISFNIPGDGVHVIQPQTLLPTITDPIDIDGFTQPGSQPNTKGLQEECDAIPRIVLDGSVTLPLYGSNDVGLLVCCSGNRIRGLVLRAFGYALRLGGANSNVIQGNFIGVDSDGRTPQGNVTGIRIENGNYNTIGGVDPEARNIISGNKWNGVNIWGVQAHHNLVQGNFIGVDATGYSLLSNKGYGIEIDYGTSNTIGGSVAGAGNVMARNNPPEVTQACIGILGPSARKNSVVGNLIGVTVPTDGPAMNTGYGIALRDGANANSIGGTSAAARNVISGFNSGGIFVGSDSNLVQGNYIGTDITGTKAILNYGGIQINGSANRIGGRSSGAGNLISGNYKRGIDISASSAAAEARDNRIEGNRIGTQADGTSPLRNVYGVGIYGRAYDNTIGDTAAGAGNIIAFNSLGVEVKVDAFGGPISNRISGNSIYGNTTLGIYLGDGVEDEHLMAANDPGDWDSGPNDLQNYPVLISAEGGSSLHVRGNLNSSANSTFTIEFFGTPTDGTPKVGEGQTYLGWTAVQTDASGNAPISTTLNVPVAAGRAITATATNYLNSTSEFSLPVVATTTGIGPGQDIPTTTALLQNYPNPFNPKTVVSSQLSVVSDVKIAIFDVLGRQIGTLVNERRGPGRYRDNFDASGLASGVYIYRMTAGSFVATKTMLLVK